MKKILFFWIFFSQPLILSQNQSLFLTLLRCKIEEQMPRPLLCVPANSSLFRFPNLKWINSLSMSGNLSLARTRNDGLGGSTYAAEQKWAPESDTLSWQPSGLFAPCLFFNRGKKKPGARLHRVGFPYIISWKVSKLLINNFRFFPCRRRYLLLMIQKCGRLLHLQRTIKGFCWRL